jgi:hypothetical protein
MRPLFPVSQWSRKMCNALFPFPLQISLTWRHNYTLNSIISRLWQPKCPWYEGLLQCLHGCVIKRELVQQVTLWNNWKSTLQWWQPDACKRLAWLLWWFILMSKPVIYGEKRDNKEWDLNWEHSRVPGYKRRSGIKEVDIMEFRVYFRMWNSAPK